MTFAATTNNDYISSDYDVPKLLNATDDLPALPAHKINVRISFAPK